MNDLEVFKTRTVICGEINIADSVIRENSGAVIAGGTIWKIDRRTGKHSERDIAGGIFGRSDRRTGHCRKNAVSIGCSKGFVADIVLAAKSG